jgi:nicotinate-nucleotide adenylyltransferase
LDFKSQEEKCINLGHEFSFMPLSLSNDRHPTISDSVTFFGGSFYPFHQGHRACLDLCPEKNIIVVLDRNPHKEFRAVGPYDEYLKVKSELEGTQYYVYPAFLTLKQVNPTCTWLPFVKISEKNLLMGDDSYMNFLSWQSPEIILSAIKKLYVVPRKFTKQDCLNQKIKISEINPNVEIIFLNDHEYKKLSSTQMR